MSCFLFLFKMIDFLFIDVAMFLFSNSLGFDFDCSHSNNADWQPTHIKCDGICQIALDAKPRWYVNVALQLVGSSLITGFHAIMKRMAFALVQNVERTTKDLNLNRFIQVHWTIDCCIDTQDIYSQLVTRPPIKKLRKHKVKR